MLAVDGVERAEDKGERRRREAREGEGEAERMKERRTEGRRDGGLGRGRSDTDKAGEEVGGILFVSCVV